jgi:hypothetical protein
VAGKKRPFTLEFNFDGDTKEPLLATASPRTLDKAMRDMIPGLITFASQPRGLVFSPPVSWRGNSAR